MPGDEEMGTRQELSTYGVEYVVLLNLVEHTRKCAPQCGPLFPREAPSV